MKAFPHSLHLYGFSPYFWYSYVVCSVWHLMCVLSNEWCVKTLPHALHPHGLAPVVFLFRLRFARRLTFSPHWLPSSLSQSLPTLWFLLRPGAWRFPTSHLCSFFREGSSKAHSSGVKFTTTSSMTTDSIAVSRGPGVLPTIQHTSQRDRVGGWTPWGL